MNLFSLTITEVPLGLCVGGGALRGDWTSLWMRMTGRWKQAEVLVNTGTATNRCSGQPSSTGLDWPCLLLYFISLFFLLSYLSVSSFCLFWLVKQSAYFIIFTLLYCIITVCVCVCVIEAGKDAHTLFIKISCIMCKIVMSNSDEWETQDGCTSNLTWPNP